MSDPQKTGLTGLGRFVSLLLVVGLVAVGAYVYEKKNGHTNSGFSNNTVAPIPAPGPDAAPANPAAGPALDATKELAPLQSSADQLPPPAAYVPKNNTIDVELSTWSGYAGFIVANNGLAPTEDSYFFKKYGFKVAIKLSEDEAWGRLNAGAMAASATTTDALPIYGKQFHVVVPAQFDYSRGADGIIVRNNIHKINDLKGQILACCQFTESDFFIRYLAQQAGLNVNMLADLNAAPDPNAINCVYTTDGPVAADLFLKDIQAGGNHLAGAITWEPRLSEVAAATAGKAHIITTNKNLLIIADILVVNQGFAEQNPKMLAGLVDGLMAGNAMVSDHLDDHLDVIGKAFNWDATQTRAEMAKVHLSNLPENLAFFNGTIAMAGSFSGIYQSSVLAYGAGLIPNPVDADHFAAPAPLLALEASGAYKAEQISIAPIASAGSAGIETDPLLSKDIRFFFDVMSSHLNESPDNTALLESIKHMLQVSPGSRVLLRGHVDDTNKRKLMAQPGNEAIIQNLSLQAMQLSKDRAAEIKRLLIEKEGIDASRIDTVGRGWEEPVSTNGDENRRVEVQWFTLE